MNPLDKESYSSEEKKENETTLSRKRKSLIPGKEVTPNGKEEENERKVSQKQKDLIQGQKVLSLILGEEVTANGKEENETMASRKRKTLISGGGGVEKNALIVSGEHLIVGEKVIPNSKKATETPKSCLASIIPENITLIYLRRSSVQDLLKDPETFECNIVGSFVRIQSDPNNYSQINSHELLQVAGVKKAQGCREVEEEYILQVIKPPLIKDIPISMLSDEYFEKSVLLPIREKIIVNKSLNIFDSLTSPWYTLFEYLKWESPLQKSAEQEQILLTVPNVITEDIKSDISCLPKLFGVEISAGVEEGDTAFVKGANASAGVDEEGDTAFVEGANGEMRGYLRIANNDPPDDPQLVPEIVSHIVVHILEYGDFINQQSGLSYVKRAPNCRVQAAGDKRVLRVTKVEKLDINMGSITDGNHNSPKLRSSEIAKNSKEADVSEIGKNSKEAEVIDISDDDNEWQGDKTDSALWYYDEQVRRGPFQARDLKEWKEEAFLPSGLKVWKRGQTPVLLDDLITKMFSSQPG